jgi:hypothetical protein
LQAVNDGEITFRVPGYNVRRRGTMIEARCDPAPAEDLFDSAALDLMVRGEVVRRLKGREQLGLAVTVIDRRVILSAPRQVQRSETAQIIAATLEIPTVRAVIADFGE